MAEPVQFDYRRAGQRFFSRIPHSVALGLDVVDGGDGWLLSRVRYRDDLIGNPATGHLHSGVLTTLIDQTSGAAAVFSSLPPEGVATLDLRIDHLRVAEAGVPIHAFAECHRVTRHICFVRCVAYATDRERPVATSVSSFMRTGKPLIRPERNRE
ncbi:MAG: PaaI family thioesterase [Ectothiorhodospiraceae bacterium]|nr:PaaI family thioesterase [Ectothiorhodospiraceae bacterium]